MHDTVPLVVGRAIESQRWWNCSSYTYIRSVKINVRVYTSTVSSRGGRDVLKLASVNKLNDQEARR